MKARDVLITIFATWEDTARIAAHDWHVHAEDMALRILRSCALDGDSWPEVNRLRAMSDGWKEAAATTRQFLRSIGGTPVDVLEQEVRDKPSTPWEKRNASGDMPVEMSPTWRVRGWTESPNVSGIAQDELDAKYERESIALDRSSMTDAAERHGLLSEESNET